MKLTNPDFADEQMALAWEALRDAESDLSQGSFRSGINRAYYTMFYASRALLALRGLGSSKHSGVISMVNKEFVSTGLLSKKASDALHSAFESRLKWDYADPKQPPGTEVAKTLQAAKEFLQEVVALIQRGAQLR